ncbi:hypothetical protein [Bradyrhizobium macuxiense]|nr:hypothetical protein [Bradyrhizobium macuxiense]
MNSLAPQSEPRNATGGILNPKLSGLIDFDQGFSEKPRFNHAA